ncbi:NAD-dependent epimerase/dehydratase family protein [Robiginitalea aurantiaca]|uniref:NAD-dependent epimerase/dehydratase family protein n=1 Tax=Robiginitalea aurantiaca TaxID=3056915 RepID=A0ABT7WB76_9FLAO|nr:NAD-dependent epimerase/dehydratase family protein [Robiginitalea aurantiaca]MDM9630168.1 NAD-dependent epimerase/dehydratase family protein [Robiginitalea aurantiaca]
MSKKILILGACGQIGTELTVALRARYGSESVIASDIREGTAELMESGPFVKLDVMDRESLQNFLKETPISEVYLMAAMLSANAEKSPARAWELNMNSLLHLLELGRENLYSKIFWPSSIAVFGPSTPKKNTPQATVMEPTTVYGISKQAGEGWASYYYRKFGVDVRSIRYPGLISWKTKPGGGTTDYAVEIFHEALEKGSYNCFLEADTALPMMYMSDAIEATLKLMDAPATALSVRTSYNLGGISFTPAELANSIRTYIPDFEISYEPDFRQEIADSWPESVDDSKAREDWGWEPRYDLDRTAREMLLNLKENS